MQDTCLSCQENLSAYADGELSLPESRRVAQHLKACRACSDVLADLLQLIRAFRSLPRPAPSVQWEAIAFELRREGLVKPRWTIPIRVATGTAVAGILAMALWSQFSPTPQSPELDAFLHEHAILSAEEAPVFYGAPSMHVIEANYVLQGGNR